jgi:parallel beta-helix repeat protein
MGVYLDNYSKNFVIHHNVIWNNSGVGIRLNSPSNNNDVFHNTVLENGKAFAVFTYRGQTPDQSGTRIINNLYSGEMQVVQGELAPEQKSNVQASSVGLLPPTPANTFHAPHRPGRDQGVVIEGFRVETIGAAPDVGAYEAGNPFWKPGPRTQPRQATLR